MSPEQVSAPLSPALTDELARALGEDSVQVREARRLTGGASRETWALDVWTADGVVELILRRDQPGLQRTGLALEAAAFRAAEAAGVPVPPIVATGGEEGPLGYEYVLSERVAGETLGRRILCDEALADVRSTLATRCGSILAAIHAIPCDAIPGLPRIDPLAAMREQLDRFAEASPVFELAYAWLRDHRGPGTGATVVHGDFRLGNLMIATDGIRAVLDWEQVHAGDPVEDLGWLCVRAWRFGGPGQVGGFGELDDLIAAYELSGGRPISRSVVRWWELYGTVRWGLGCLEMASWHLGGRRRSVELAAIGRRVWEQEYDAMLLLEEIAGEA
jgi:aminoglycoside phosphotransferase (APT) family kinase protein